MKAWVLVLVFLELCFVSWTDIRIKKISNWWFLVHLVLFVCLHFLDSHTYELSFSTFIFPLGFLVLGFGLFWMGIMGAGDSKFLASLFLIVPSDLHLLLLQKLIYSTLIVGFLVLSFKIARDFKAIRAYALSSYWRGIVSSIRSRFSYAPVILLAWLIFGSEVWK